MVRQLSLPIYTQGQQTATLVSSNQPTLPALNQVQFEVEYRCPPGWTPAQPISWPKAAKLGPNPPPVPAGAIFPVAAKDVHPVPGLIAVEYKIRQLQPGETARPSEGLIRRETMTRTQIATAKTMSLLQAQQKALEKQAKN